MNSGTIDISEGWQLGWCKQTWLNKWVQVYGFWKIENCCLTGKGFWPHIFANVEPEDNYVWQSVVRIDSEQGELGIIVKRSLQRIAYYDICFRPGSQIKVSYVYSSAPDSVLLENVGPVVESGKEYRVQIFVQNGIIKVCVDDEPVGQFERTCRRGPPAVFSGPSHG